MKQKVSIIVPVYNTEEFLKQAIQSLQNQTHKNIEIVLVDDHSTDKSFEIMQEFAEKDSRIKIFKTKKPSGGPLRGREFGIKKATGDWVTMMDCDDFVSDKFVENLLKITKNGKYDIAVSGHSRYYSEGKIDKFLWENYSQNTNERLVEFYNHFIKEDFWTDPTDTIGQQLVKSEVAKKAVGSFINKAPNNIWAEDTFMALAFIACSENGINFEDKHDFFWRQREGSGSHGGFSSTADKKSFYKLMNKIFSQKYAEFSKNLPKISVIIPAYNVGEFIFECVESVKNQTYQNIEMIIVNDGSTDNTKEICDNLAKTDSRIKLINKKNEKLNFARKTGFENSTGEFITFVDGDDAISKKAIEKLYKNLIAKNCDISISGYERFTDKFKDNIKNDNFIEKEISSRNEIIKYCLVDTNFGIKNIYNVTVWGRLYKRKIIEKIDWNFSNYRINEDEFESLQMFNFAKKVYLNNDILYYYRNNPNSLTNKKYFNINPSGKEINVFEFNNELMEKTTKYLKDSGNFEFEILKRYKIINSVRLREANNNGYLDKNDINIAIDNYDLIFDNIFAENIALKEKNRVLISENVEKTNELECFLSTKRSIKLVAGNVKRLLGKIRDGKKRI